MRKMESDRLRGGRVRKIAVLNRIPLDPSAARPGRVKSSVTREARRLVNLCSSVGDEGPANDSV